MTVPAPQDEPPRFDHQQSLDTRSPTSTSFIPGGRRAAAAGLGIAVAMAAALTMAVLSESAALLRFDRSVTSWFRTWADALGWPVELAYEIGEWTGGFEASLTGGIVVLLLMGQRSWHPAAFLTFNLIVGGLATEFIKRSVGRARPPGASEWEQEPLKSFPSGHATVGIYVYLALGLLLLQFARHRDVHWVVRVGGWALVVFGPFLGITRLVLGVHWPSDVLGGWAVGSTVLLTSSLIFWVGLNAWPARARHESRNDHEYPRRYQTHETRLE